MLPFLKPKQVAGIVIQKRKADGSQAPAENPDQGDQALAACADDLIRAINAKDGKAAATALRAAFNVLQAEPQEEYSEGDAG